MSARFTVDPLRLSLFASYLDGAAPCARLPVYAEVAGFSEVDPPPPLAPDGRFKDQVARALAATDPQCRAQVQCADSVRKAVGQGMADVFTPTVRDALDLDKDSTFELLSDALRRVIAVGGISSITDVSAEQLGGLLYEALRASAGRLSLETRPRRVPEQKVLRTFPLGLLATDHVGYLSYDLQRLPAEVRTSLAETISFLRDDPDNGPPEGTSLWVYPLGLSALCVDALQQRRFADDLVLARIDVSLPVLPPEITNLGLPSMQNPGLPDWRVSPGSFATNPAALLGDDGCETIMPANVAEHEYYLHQVIGLSLDEVQLPVGSAAANKVRPGLIVDYRIRLVPIGHSLGQILYTFGLAPGESVNFAVIDWTRRDSALRSESTKLDESLVHELRRDRVISEAVTASLKEWQSGSSSMGGVAASLGGAIGASGMGAAAGLSGSIGGSYSTTRGSRDLAANTVQKLSDNIAQAATSSRELNSTVVVQSAQAENQAIETRTIVNYNHSHALTILYYEVLRHYRLVTELVARRPALLTNIHGGIAYWSPTPPRFEIYWPVIVENRKILEGAILDDRHKGGFDVVERRIKQDRIKTLSPPPSATPPPPQGPYFRYFVFEMRTGGLQAEGSDEDVHIAVSIDRNDKLGPVPLNKGQRISPPGAFFQKDTTYWFAGRTEPPEPPTIAWGEIEAIAVEIDLQRGGDRETDISFSFIKAVGVDVNGTETVLFEHDYAAGHLIVDNDWKLILPTRRPVPPPAPTAHPTQAEVEDEVKFLEFNEHLLNRRAHYERVLRLNAPIAQRAFELASLEAEPGKSLLEKVDNRPVEVLGDYVAYPCIDPVWAGKIMDTLRRLEDSEVAAVERLVTFPTRGVFTEAKLGHCNASELIDNTRFWDWQTSPIPHLAPEIGAVQPVTPRPETPQGLVATPFPASLLNIVNPPNAPDPTGLAAALTTLAAANIFRDMSGRTEVADLLKKLSDNSVAIAGTAQKAATGGVGTKGNAGSDSLAGGSYSAGRGATGAGVVGGPRATPNQPSMVNRDLQDFGNVMSRLQSQGLISSEAAQSATQTALNSASGLDLQNASDFGQGSSALGQELQQEELARREGLSAGDIENFTPSSEHVLVSYAREWTPPEGLNVVNWRRAGLDHYGSIYNGRPIGGRLDGVTPHAYATRRLPISIILHETVGWNVVGAGVGKVKDASGVEHDYGFSVHFTVGPDGTIYQHNDIAQYLEHGTKASPLSVGIEVTNASVVDTANPGPISLTPSGATSFVRSLQTAVDVGGIVAEDRERLKIAWVDGTLVDAKPRFLYVLPERGQLEAVTQLVAWLCSGSDATAVATFLNADEQSTWRQHIIRTTGAGGSASTKHSFLLHGHPVWRDKAFDDFDGIFAHSNFQANRSDGGPIGLYAWLRLYCRKTVVDAYPLFRTLLSDKTLVHEVEVANGRKAWAIDVSSVAPVTVHI